MRPAWTLALLLLLGGCTFQPHHEAPTPGEQTYRAFVDGGERPSVSGRRTFTAWTRTPTANEWLSDEVLGEYEPAWRTDPSTGTVTFASGATWVLDPLAEPATNPAAYRWAEKRFDEELKQIPRSDKPTKPLDPGVQP